MFRERDQLRQRAHPPARGLPRPRAGARRGLGRTRGRRDRQHPRHRGGHPARRPPAAGPGGPGAASSSGSCRPRWTSSSTRRATTGRVHSWARVPFHYAVQRRRGALEIACATGEDGARLAKLIRFGQRRGADGALRLGSGAAAPDDLFATELSLAGQLRPRREPAADVWRFPIETVAKSERGLDRTRQGESLTLRWPARLGEAARRASRPGLARPWAPSGRPGGIRFSALPFK